MKRNAIWVLWGVLAMAALVSGCRKAVPETALNKFISRTGELEGQALNDTLYALAAGDSPYRAFAHYLLGNHFYEAGGDSARRAGWSEPDVVALLDSAEIHFNAAVAADSSFLEPMVNLGSLWDDRAEQMGSREDRDQKLATAKMYYEMALKVDPTDEKARCNLGSLYLRQRRVTEAITEFQTVLKHDSRSSLAHYNLAIMFAEEKIYREAISEWELASKYDPEGDIGDRSRDNIKIVRDLMSAPDPGVVK